MEYGELYVSDLDGTRTLPTYTCGHCSDVVVMRAERTRERQRCLRCYKIICEKRPLCLQACTPIHALAKDHFEAGTEWTRFVNPIMAGARTLDEAEGFNARRVVLTDV